MASSGPNGPSTGANDASTGTLAWDTPSLVTAVDSDPTFALSTVDNTVTNYLFVSGFGFSLPSGATVDGVVVEILREMGNSSSFGRTVKDEAIYILKAGAVVGSNKAATSTNWPTTFQYATYGASTDLWGTTWTESEVNDSGFGVAISARINKTSGSVFAEVDYARITVYYTEAAAGQPTAKRMGGVEFAGTRRSHTSSVRIW